MRKKVEETCEMCSAVVHQPVTIKVEGALLNVCPNCTSFGNIVEKPKARMQKSSNSTSPFSTPKTTVRLGSTPRFRPKPNSSDKDLIDDFAGVIRTARMKLKMTQEDLATKTGLSIPFVKSMEAGKTRPTDAASQKLERELNIELLYTPEIELEHSEKSKAKATTLGDIAVIKRFEYDND